MTTSRTDIVYGADQMNELDRVLEEFVEELTKVLREMYHSVNVVWRKQTHTASIAIRDGTKSLSFMVGASVGEKGVMAYLRFFNRSYAYELGSPGFHLDVFVDKIKSTMDAGNISISEFHRIVRTIGETSDD